MTYLHPLSISRIALALSLILVAGCRGGSASLPNLAAEGQQEVRQAHGGASLVAIGVTPEGPAGGNVLIASVNGASLTAVSSFKIDHPYHVAFDKQNNLYVVNSSDAISIFAPPYTKGPYATLTQKNGYTGNFFDVEFDNSNNVYLYQMGSSAEILIYKAPVTNSSMPSKTITVASGGTRASEWGQAGPPLAIDGAGDIFANKESQVIVEYKAPHYTPVTIKNGVADPTAIAIAPNGKLYVANCLSADCVGTGSKKSTITVYAPPYTGAPVQTITQDVDEPYGIAVDANSNLFVSDFVTGVHEYSAENGSATTLLGSDADTFFDNVALTSTGTLIYTNAPAGEVGAAVPSYSSAHWSLTKLVYPWAIATSH